MYNMAASLSFQKTSSFQPSPRQAPSYLSKAHFSPFDHVSGLPAGIFQTKSPNLGNFGGSCNGRCWYILRPFGIFNGHLVYLMAIWYIQWPFGIFTGHLVY
jgi:hypothetical protein